MKPLLITTILLAGCTINTPSTETIANSAQESLNAISATLTPECNTKAVQSQINAVSAGIKATVSACEAEKAAITQEKIRWKWAFIALAIIIAAYFAQKVIK